MLTGYHRKVRNIALPYIVRNVDVPEIDLAVGYAEQLAPLPIPLSRNHKIKSTKLAIKAITRQEHLAYQGQGTPFTQDDFPLLGYMGEAIPRG